MGRRHPLVVLGCLAAMLAIGAHDPARAVEPIGSTTIAQNQVARELAGASGPLAAGDSVYLSEVVKTGTDSLAKFVFLDSTNLSLGPISRVVLDRFVYEGDPSAQKVAVNLAKGLFRFTTGGLDKKAYTITTPTAAIGVRGTILDIAVRSSADTRVTLVEGIALVCARRAGVTLEQQARACAAHRGRCDCEILNIPGQTAQVKKVGGSNQASMISTPVNFASLCAGDAALCSSDAYAYAGFGGAGALCGR